MRRFSVWSLVSASCGQLVGVRGATVFSGEAVVSVVAQDVALTLWSNQ